MSTITPGARAARTWHIAMPSAPLPIRPETSLRDLALNAAGAWRVLGEHHIDYSRASARALRDACAAIGVDVERVVADLEAARERAHLHGAPPETRWVDHAPWELVEHLLAAHHELTWRELARLGALAREHQRAIPEVADLVAMLRTELEPHMQREERVLFPWVMELRVHEAEGTSPPPAPSGDVRNPLRVMHADHEHAADLLARLRAATRGYAAPHSELRPLYEGLDALDRDLVRHMSLENDVLFPMLLELAR